MSIRSLFVLHFILFLPAGFASLLMKPASLELLSYQKPIFEGEYDPKISTLDTVLDFPFATRASSPEQINQLITLWAKESDRVQLKEYARSHEGRPLYYLVISSPSNLKQSAEIKNKIQQLKDPRKLSDAEAQTIIKTLPAVAWFAYSIHGNETSGSDAALAIIYHLLASQSDAVKQWLNQMVLIIDPAMNPDGRARFISRRQEARGIAPNVDSQSVVHLGTWPYGRANHYLFDLNRDFLMGMQPENRGRIKALNEWRPQLMIDAHEMGAHDTYLFSPSREPINSNIPTSLRHWSKRFASEQARGFDEQRWPYYTGEWFENFYPGYSNYVEYKGSLHILYEQARIAEDGVQGYNGEITTYKESVHHQYLSTLLNIKTLAKHSKKLYQQYYEDKKATVALDYRHANRSFAILPTTNKTRLRALTDTLVLHDLELFETTKEMTVSGAINQFNETVNYLKLPIGTIIVPNSQPDGDWVSALLEFDSALKDEVLEEERQKTLRDGSSVMYDTTAWNLSMMLGLPAFTLSTNLRSNLKAFADQQSYQAVTALDTKAIAYAVDGNDDASVSFAARLVEEGLKVRVIDKATELGEAKFDRGSVFVLKSDNRPWEDTFNQTIITAAADTKQTIIPVLSGLGEDDFPDIGGSHFKLLQTPKIAVLTGNPVSSLDFGTIWYAIDKYLGIRHSHLHIDHIQRADLRRYNTIVIPHLYGTLDASLIKMLKPWIKSGGTLIAIDGAATALLKSEGFSSVKLIHDALEKADDFDLSLRREWLSRQKLKPELLELSRGQTVSVQPQFPLSTKSKSLSAKQLQKIDKWQQNFMPSGALLAARTDQKHWLTFGTAEGIPLYFANNPVIMSDDSSEAVIRMGIYQSIQENMWENIKKSIGDEKTVLKLGWATLPENTQLKLRLSGLVWPEAAQRISNSSYLTRERNGKGQVIYFAGQPNFRAMTLASNRLLLNAIVYGAGLGTRAKVEF